MATGTVGQTKVLGRDPNQFEWQIPGADSAAFEDAVFRLIQLKLAAVDGSVTVSQTRRSGDQGRDIEIKFKRPVVIGTRTFFPASEGQTSAIYVECKATELERLNDSFLSDASQHRAGEFVAYALITNATLTPYTFYRAQLQWKQLGAEFILVDRARLLSWLFTPISPATSISRLAPEFADRPLGDNVVMSYQSHTDASAFSETQTFLVVRNYSHVPQRIGLSLASDLSWSSDVALETILEAGEDRAYRLEARRKLLGLDAPLLFQVNQHRRSHRIQVTSGEADVVLDPPFLGVHHLKIRDEIRSVLERMEGFHLISVRGDAGAGKTRTIQEAIAPLESGALQIFRVMCSSQSGGIDFSPVREMAERFGVSFPSSTDHDEFRSALRALQDFPFPALLLLEDVHHASADVIRTIKDQLINTPPHTHPVTLIVTGRDDYTFPNADYFSLLDILQNTSSDWVTDLRIETLSDDDAHQLISAVATDLPGSAIERVYALGQNNPFIILECLQYLLDVGLAQLLSRRTIGVTDPERFKGLVDLPDNVESLLRRRIEALLNTTFGSKAVDLLCAAAFFGLTLGEEMIRGFLTEEALAPCLALLVHRRFLRLDKDRSEAQFTHENLFHFIKRWLATSDEAAAIANRVCGSSGFALLPQLSRGDLLTIAGRFTDAIVAFDAILKRIAAISNFSSEEIDRSYFAHLSYVYTAATAARSTAETKTKIALALAYMGVHNFPLFQGEAACGRAQVMLDDIYANSKDGLAPKRAIRQLRAHALQNMGRATASLKIMLELQAEINLQGGAEPALEYDLFDRLQEHYRKSNHAALMSSYGQLARRAARKSKDDKIKSSYLITQSLVDLYGGSTRSMRAAMRALDAAKGAGVRRFIVFNRLTELISVALYQQDNPDALMSAYRDGEELLRTAAVENFSDSIIRLELLLATLALQVFADGDQARRTALAYINAGRAAAVRFGVGLYGWALDNLDAVITLKEVDVPQKLVQQKFVSMVDKLRRRNLTFVGACDGTYPNVHAISNAVRFFSIYSEREAAAFITKNIFAYQLDAINDLDNVLTLVTSARSGKVIFWPPRGLEMFRYPRDTGYFTPLF